MARRRVLLLLKPFDVYPPRPNPTVAAAAAAAAASSSSSPRTINPRLLSFLDDRRRVHKDTINFCRSVLERKALDWELVLRNHLSCPIHHVDLVITVGGDGTLLQASHFLDGSTPVVGVNSDPTRVKEVDEFSDEFDATRSTGYLCAASAENFEEVLDEILEGRKHPTELSRISVNLNGSRMPTFALNDILVSHPCPASVSRFSFRIKSKCGKSSHLVNSRSSGFRVCTAAGSTAAMLSAGGFPMPISSRELQYIVREPILPQDSDISLMHGVIKSNESMRLEWYSQEGVVYVDGSHVVHSIRHGDSIEMSSEAPILKVFLPQRLTS
uniref:NADH kinase n=1 Tax=Ananas comosus var. bracteatus TaxID=296719 RepID=A0A6V7PU19_ANACO|nr:unnamed protein product [Ananas comosus var. bracteatus]